MIQDKLAIFGSAFSVAVAASTVNLTDVYDLQSSTRGMGNGQPIYLVISVHTAIVTGGSAGTLQFRVVSDDTASPSTTTCSVHVYSPIYVTDDDPTIPAGTQLFHTALPICNDYVSKSVAGVYVTTGQGAPYERYVGIQAIIGTTTITAGAVDAFLTYDPHGWRALPDGTN